jgi:hypothetical protein
MSRNLTVARALASAQLPVPARCTVEGVIVAHADWGVDPRKQWAAVARQDGAGRWIATAAQPVGQSGTLRERFGVGDSVGDATETALIGFDFPIGLPRTYAAATGVTSYTELLPALGHGDWMPSWVCSA